VAGAAVPAAMAPTQIPTSFPFGMDGGVGAAVIPVPMEPVPRSLPQFSCAGGIAADTTAAGSPFQTKPWHGATTMSAGEVEATQDANLQVSQAALSAIVRKPQARSPGPSPRSPTVVRFAEPAAAPARLPSNGNAEDGEISDVSIIVSRSAGHPGPGDCYPLAAAGSERSPDGPALPSLLPSLSLEPVSGACGSCSGCRHFPEENQARGCSQAKAECCEPLLLASTGPSGQWVGGPPPSRLPSRVQAADQGEQRFASPNAAAEATPPWAVAVARITGTSRASRPTALTSASRQGARATTPAPAVPTSTVIFRGLRLKVRWCVAERAETLR
jgi:hypothetical protein